MLSESSWVSIGTVILMALITAFMRFKQKSERADMIQEIDERVDKRATKIDMDFDELKKDTIEPLKEKVSKISTDQTITANSLQGIDKGLDEIKELIKEKDSKNTTNFNRIYEKLDTKQDK